MYIEEKVMRTAVFLMTMLLITLFATAAFSEDGTLYLFNPTKNVRTVKLKVTIPTGSSAQPSTTLAADGGEDFFEVYLQQPLELDEDWYLQFMSPSGKMICDAHFTRTKKGFTPGILGGCFTHRNVGGPDVLLTITK
ncbi:MAG: hypothetical protein JEY79_01885 [Pseudodesulfovibrio sp.]|nr:hypothetical protein [Pseudodesulfovibrio sp.]